MVEGDVLHTIGVTLQRAFVVARLEVPHLDGGVLTGGGHQAVQRVEQHLVGEKHTMFITQSTLVHMHCTLFRDANRLYSVQRVEQSIQQTSAMLKVLQQASRLSGSRLPDLSAP